MLTRQSVCGTRPPARRCAPDRPYRPSAGSGLQPGWVGPCSSRSATPRPSGYGADMCADGSILRTVWLPDLKAVVSAGPAAADVDCAYRSADVRADREGSNDSAERETGADNN
jgi:hypothetical protein